MPSSSPNPSRSLTPAPLTQKLEAEIRTRRAAITDAPWGSSRDLDGQYTVQAGAWVTLTEGFASSGDVASIIGDDETHRYRRADFIAQSPRDIDALLAEVVRLRGRVAELGATCTTCGETGYHDIDCAKAGEREHALAASLADDPQASESEPTRTPAVGDRYDSRQGGVGVTVTRLWTLDNGTPVVDFAWHDDKPGDAGSALPLPSFHRAYQLAAGMTLAELDATPPGAFRCTCGHWDNVHGTVCWAQDCSCTDFAKKAVTA